jgi:hypothetical protein
MAQTTDPLPAISLTSAATSLAPADAMVTAASTGDGGGDLSSAWNAATGDDDDDDDTVRAANAAVANAYDDDPSVDQEAVAAASAAFCAAVNKYFHRTVDRGQEHVELKVLRKFWDDVATVFGRGSEPALYVAGSFWEVNCLFGALMRARGYADWF